MAMDRNGSDWVRAAARRLAAGGIGAVAVETLARDLGVTKGSFYWHFRDRAALLAALLADWARHATEPLLRRLEGSASTAQAPRARLSRLAATVAGEGAGTLDPAIRAWAHHDPAAARAVQGVDGRGSPSLPASSAASASGRLPPGPGRGSSTCISSESMPWPSMS